MPHGAAHSECMQQEAPGRCSASEQPEAVAQAMTNLKQLMAESLNTIQHEGLSSTDGRQTVVGALPVESFQCQLWEPARAVQELQPGTVFVPSGLSYATCCLHCLILLKLSVNSSACAL